MVKRIIVLCSALVLAFGSWQCSKSSDDKGCSVVPPSEEEAEILKYVQDHQMNAVKDENSGVYYEIIDPGTGGTPNLNSQIFIKYEGRLLNGNIFDEQSDPSRTGWQLRTLIPGWQVVIPKIRKGGKVKMIIPSALAYGCRANGNIPANSILYFYVELNEFY
ncbi:MAG TPA: FKBP-type peptidyl-prolyl cis-trans isomerase [Flavihumibacter sp.]|jgi:FKBP-type peptidyl-prolyl cis-trans isomerase FkpA